MNIISYKQAKECFDKLQIACAFQTSYYTLAFRGESFIDFELLSGISRACSSVEEVSIKELELLESFKKLTLAEDIKIQLLTFNKEPNQNIIDWSTLIQAQHLKLKTRLLDWSLQWEIALYFAVEDEKYFDVDGRVWVFECPRKYVFDREDAIEFFKKYSFSELNDFCFFNSPFYNDGSPKMSYGDRNKFRQFGKFSIQPLKNCLTPMNNYQVVSPYLTEFIIDAKSKPQIKHELSKIGFNKCWIYPKEEEIFDFISKVENLNKQILGI